ncbi:hypothetical protein STEG23_030314, partial [Scotinomys teguina]
MSITVTESTSSKQALVSRAKILISTWLLDLLPTWKWKEAFQDTFIGMYNIPATREYGYVKVEKAGEKLPDVKGRDTKNDVSLQPAPLGEHRDRLIRIRILIPDALLPFLLLGILSSLKASTVPELPKPIQLAFSHNVHHSNRKSKEDIIFQSYSLPQKSQNKGLIKLQRRP